MCKSASEILPFGYLCLLDVKVLVIGVYSMKETYKIRYSKNISWTLLCDEIFIFDEITNELTLLKGMLKDFWILLLKTDNFDEIITTLSTKYKNDEEEIIKEVIIKIKELRRKNLIVVEGIL